jgi:hypothetical protein
MGFFGGPWQAQPIGGILTRVCYSAQCPRHDVTILGRNRQLRITGIEFRDCDGVRNSIYYGTFQSLRREFENGFVEWRLPGGVPFLDLDEFGQSVLEQRIVQGRTLRSIGEDVGKDRERIRQVEARAASRVRSTWRAGRLWVTVLDLWGPEGAGDRAARTIFGETR